MGHDTVQIKKRSKLTALHHLPSKDSIIKSSVAGLYLMINNPGAITGRSTLLPLKQQVSAAELDNSDACKGAFRGLNHQHLTPFNTSMTNISVVFLFHLVLLLTFCSSQSPTMKLMPSFFPLLKLKKFIPTSVFCILKCFLSTGLFRGRGLLARIPSILWRLYFFLHSWRKGWHDDGNFKIQHLHH